MKLRADRRIGLLLGGVLLLTFVAIGATVALPASDPAVRKTETKLSAAEARGLRVYRREGCWFCAAMAKKKNDSGSSVAVGSYAGRSPSLLGIDRSGPDMSAATSMSKADLVKYLRKAHGDVPSFDYLSDADLNSLATYLLSLH